MTGLIIIVGSKSCPDVQFAVKFAQSAAAEYPKIKLKTMYDKRTYPELVDNLLQVEGIEGIPREWPDKHPTVHIVELNKGEGVVLASYEYPKGCPKEDMDEHFRELDVHINGG